MRDQTAKIHSVLLRIYSGICAHKEDLRLKPLTTVRSVTFEVVPHENDFRKLIGKQGILYNYMLYILRCAGNRVWITEDPPSQLKVSLDVERTGDGREDVKVPIDPNYDRVKMMELIRDTCLIVFDKFELEKQDTSSKSLVQVFVSDNPNPLLFEAMNKIFWAYGKATGRLIELEFSNVNQSAAVATPCHSM